MADAITEKNYPIKLFIFTDGNIYVLVTAENTAEAYHSLCDFSGNDARNFDFWNDPDEAGWGLWKENRVIKSALLPIGK
ncbi:MAG TPA: hypothetical protein DCS07_10545 [Bdellovibrionales bacterium]|nr:hypothetical protein [Bdellovibrionales bacterium]